MCLRRFSAGADGLVLRVVRIFTDREHRVDVRDDG
jgi:hypothetical protein